MNIRHADAAALAAALQASRRDTLATFAACASALARNSAAVPQREGLNPPLWELGHIGWFQEFWLVRNPQRALGPAADPEAPRGPGVRSNADALYDSSRVAHATRWALPLPDVAATQDDLARQLDASLGLLEGGELPYFFRLALLHEDMHHEAALYMAQALGLAIDEDPRWQAVPLRGSRRSLRFEAGRWTLGSAADEGFAFDNELTAHAVDLPAFEIDSQVVRWADYLPFVEATRLAPPRYLRRAGAGWQRQCLGRWIALDQDLPACHLSAAEAEAWCRWAGRRLPTEAEWERAAVLQPDSFEWGAVWEWTASAFLPFPGFIAHPYRDYSAPWFNSRRVLRGASFMTQPRIRDPRYRNFFLPDRSDVPAGFRSCAARLPS
ncbi:ergothioneine biosynthesis protein EgtB [soil metagenome]